MKQPLVSICIPCYNHSLYVNECLTSVKEQIYDNFEVILIDDGSVDDSFDVAKTWLENNASFDFQVMKQENAGITSTLNRCIGLAKGEYVAILASDDRLTKNSICSRVNILDKHKERDVLFSDAYVIDENGKVIHNSAIKTLFKVPSDKIFKEDIVNQTLVLNWCVAGPVTLVRRSFYDEVSYSSQKLVEDRPFYLEACKRGKTVYSEEPSAFYRCHGSASTKSSLRVNVLLDVAQTNVEYSKYFSGIARLFLSSYRIDLRLLQNDGTISAVRYNAVKIFRKVLSILYSWVYLLFKRV